jgi:hypothetical protein
VPLGEASLRVSRVEEDGSFNGALYSLKAFGIATALVVAGATASVWGVKTYLGAKDVSAYVYVFFSVSMLMGFWTSIRLDP